MQRFMNTLLKSKNTMVPIIRTGSILKCGNGVLFSNQLRFFSDECHSETSCGFTCNKNCHDCHKTTMCWSCHHNTDCNVRFCPSCHKIQPVYSEEEGGGNYFQLFGLPQSYDINLAKLESNFKNLQKVIHPDLFSNKSEEEKAVSAKVSSTINVAHNKLKNPITRAAYIVKLITGKDVLAEDANYKIPMDMLMEVMEIREKLTEAKTKEDKQKIENDVMKSFQKHENAFRCSLCKQDENALCDEAVAMKYYDNIIKEIQGLSNYFCFFNNKQFIC